RSANKKLSKFVVVSRFSMGSGFEPGASAAATNRCATGRGVAVSLPPPPHETSVSAAPAPRSKIAKRIAVDPRTRDDQLQAQGSAPRAFGAPEGTGPTSDAQISAQA